MSEDHITSLDRLNLAKTILTGYIIIFCLILRISQFLLLPIVLFAGSPIFLIYFCSTRAAEKRANEQN